MDAQEITQLFDFYWFGLEVIKESPLLPSQTSAESLEPELSGCPSWEVPSSRGELSSQTSFSSGSSTPRSVLPQLKLHTIVSGKEVDEETPKELVLTEKRRMDKKRKHRSASSKSLALSDLEFEELKGFMDLGFVFSEEDKHSSLASIIPGLQRLGKEDQEQEKEKEEEEKKMVARRPYLSEAWEVMMNQRKEKEKQLVKNWRLPALSNEDEIKYHLRCWAHSVASAIK